MPIRGIVPCSGEPRAAPRQRRPGKLDLLRPDDDLVAREVGEALHAAGVDVDRDEVLDSDTGLALEVDAGLDREHRPQRKWYVGAAAAEARQLVGRDAD